MECGASDFCLFADPRKFRLSHITIVGETSFPTDTPPKRKAGKVIFRDQFSALQHQSNRLVGICTKRGLALGIIHPSNHRPIHPHNPHINHSPSRSASNVAAQLR